ncbi:MAG: ferrochelatase [Limisphaerales bacterium]
MSTHSSSLPPLAPGTGVLLMNLGSPDSPAVPDVRTYLREFLMDGRVLDAPWPIRFFVVHGLILPRRPVQSAHAYQSIWGADGSPLIHAGRQVRDLLAQGLDAPVALCMRYRHPTPSAALETLRQQGVRTVRLVPLFPHFAMSSFETAVEKVRSVVRESFPEMSLEVVAPYYAHPDYLDALADSVRPFLQQPFDRLLVSFHGIPERHLRKSDPTRSHCLASADCCSRPSPAHATCYRHQCFETVRGLLPRIGLSNDQVSVSFQSRLGRDPWLKPYTDHELIRFAQSGVRRLLVLCPAFVADCLETLEEIGMRGRESFLEAGGTELTLIPCLNTHPRWIQALRRLVAEPATATRNADPTATAAPPRTLKPAETTT